MRLGTLVRRVQFKACADARAALDAAWEAHLHDAAPTIAAVLDHRLAEAQRLGLRVKALKVPRDLIDRRYLDVRAVRPLRCVD